MIKPTTALKKISALEKRIWCVQGGQGAAKTFSILIIIVNHVLKNPDKEVYIVSAELSKMRDTVLKDFIKILRAFGVYEKVKMTGVDYGQPKCIVKHNKSFVRFIGLDKEDVGKGLRSDIVYVNEANKINFETYRELTSRAKRVIVDYNPNSRFWAHEEVITRIDCSFLKLTYADNEFLSVEERSEIEGYKSRAFFNPNLDQYDIPENVKSKYWRNKWRVYGLGMEGATDGLVFEEYNEWETTLVWPNAYEWRVYGLDFGYENSKTALIEVMLSNGELFYKQHMYAIKQNNKMINDALEASIAKRDEIGADYSDSKSIDELYSWGWNIKKATKGADSIVHGIDVMKRYKMNIWHESKDLQDELRSYKWAEDKEGSGVNKPVKKKDDAIDASRYGTTLKLGMKQLQTYA